MAGPSLLRNVVVLELLWSVWGESPAAHVWLSVTA